MSERGTITLWLLGLCLMLLVLGGLAVDLGRAFSTRHALAATADAAALAGAGAVDTDRYRRDGTLTLDPTAAEARARASVASQGDPGGVARVRVTVAGDTVSVEVVGEVPLTLLRLVRGARPFTVVVRATARPHLRP